MRTKFLLLIMFILCINTECSTKPYIDEISLTDIVDICETDNDSISKTKQTITIVDYCKYADLNMQDDVQYVIRGQILHEIVDDNGNKHLELLYEKFQSVDDYSGEMEFLFDIDDIWIGENLTIKYKLFKLTL